jgi:hypothetical protein
LGREEWKRGNGRGRKGGKEEGRKGGGDGRMCSGKYGIIL